MGKKCFVYGCSDYKLPNTTFHKFPKTDGNKWALLIRTRNNQGNAYEYNENSVVCGWHFKNQHRFSVGNKHHLTPNAHPTLFKGYDKNYCLADDECAEPIKNENKKFDSDSLGSFGMTIYFQMSDEMVQKVVLSPKTSPQTNLEIKNELETPTEKTYTDMNLQVNDEKPNIENYFVESGYSQQGSSDEVTIDDLVIEIINDEDDGNVKNEEEESCDEDANFREMEARTLQEFADKMNSMEHFNLNKFLKFLGTDSDLYNFTGLQSFDLLNRIVLCVQEMKSAANIIKSLAVPPELAIVMVFAKLKTNLTFKQLATVFRLHSATLSDIFSKFVPILRFVFEIVIFWPTKKQDAPSMPNYITSNFVNCRAIYSCFQMDCECSEMEIQKLQKLTAEIKASLYFSEPRSTEKHILKFRLTINRLGLVSHVKSVYREKVSEKYEFLTEGLLEKLEENDSARVAKDVVIVKEESSEDFNLVMKPILNHPSGVHIERSKQRIRSFKVCQDKVSAHMLQHIDDIIVIVCSIANLSSPLLDDSIF